MVLNLHGHGGHIAHVTKFILINFHFLGPKIFILNWVTNGPLFLRKIFISE